MGVEEIIWSIALVQYYLRVTATTCLAAFPTISSLAAKGSWGGSCEDLKSREKVARLDASYTESPYLSPKNYQEALSRKVEEAAPLRSKAYESAIVNLSANLPLPSSFYQNHHRRIFYNDLLPKHQQFNDEYIYAFNWEDPRVDCRLLNIQKDDVILTITSAGDNILDYLLEGPRRVHAVDLNPNQNHLLELKVAAFSALSYSGTWH